MVGSSQGGMSIEDVAQENPSAILKEPVDIFAGLTRQQAVSMAGVMGFSPACIDQVKNSKVYYHSRFKTLSFRIQNA